MEDEIRMSEAPQDELFVRKYLDPGDRLGEVLFGLIMVLTFTLTAGLTVGAEPDAARELLIATVGCNIAWGIIDGCMYIMTAMLTRGRRAEVLRQIQAAGDERAVHAILGKALDGTLIGLERGRERVVLFRELHRLALRLTPERTRPERGDLLGAFACFCLVILATIPAVLPFLFLDDAYVALRVSNLLLLIMLFVVGHQWGKHANANSWATGVVCLVAGLALVGVAVALGG
jgi:VIT1/CCC1 family predicted Fe2+/Mn2+ transporter